MNHHPSVPPQSIWSWDVFLLGGFSVMVCLACWAFSDKSLSVMTMSQLAFGLAFAVNHPHFLSSYVLLYNDFRGNVGKQWRYTWAAVGAPLLIGGFLVYALSNGRADLMGFALNSMFFLVGWHYVKQVFGCIVVTSANRRLFYQPWERRLILANLFSLWSLSWINGQGTSGSFSFYGINYQGWGVPHELVNVAYVAVAVTGITMLGLHVRKYIEEGRTPTVPGLAALAALYVWYLPTFSHPAFAYLIPFFHSLQYLTFVWSFKKNQVAAQVSGLQGREQRLVWCKKFLGFAVTALVLGALSFEFVPKFLDSQNWLHEPSLGTSPILAAMLIFINVHHYFIDNAIWRSNNEQVKRYLFSAPRGAEEKDSRVAA